MGNGRFGKNVKCAFGCEGVCHSQYGSFLFWLWGIKIEGIVVVVVDFTPFMVACEQGYCLVAFSFLIRVSVLCLMSVRSLRCTRYIYVRLWGWRTPEKGWTYLHTQKSVLPCLLLLNKSAFCVVCSLQTSKLILFEFWTEYDSWGLFFFKTIINNTKIKYTTKHT